MNGKIGGQGIEALRVKANKARLGGPADYWPNVVLELLNKQEAMEAEIARLRQLPLFEEVSNGSRR